MDPPTKKIPTHCPELRPYEAKLGLQWPVRYFLVSDASSVEIVSDQESRKNIIHLPRGVLTNPDTVLVDEVGALCKAALAERLDPLYATLFFRRRYGGLSGKKAQEFTSRAHQLQLAWLPVVELWTHELRHSLWPKLTEVDERSFAETIEGLALMGARNLLRQTQTLFGIAMQHAQQRRRKERISSNLWTVLKSIGLEVGESVKQLEDYLTSLPALSDKPDEARQQLENAVRRISKLLSLPFTPRLVWEAGAWVWDVEL